MDGRRPTTAAAVIRDQQVHLKNHQVCSCSPQYLSWELSWGRLVVSHCCSGVLTEVSLWAWVQLCLFFISLLTSSPLTRWLADALTCPGASSSVLGKKSEFGAWNFVFPFSSLCSPAPVVPGYSTHVWLFPQSLLLTKVFHVLPGAHPCLTFSLLIKKWKKKKNIWPQRNLHWPTCGLLRVSWKMTVESEQFRLFHTGNENTHTHTHTPN